MTLSDKPKRKNAPTNPRKFQLVLVVWMIVSVLAAGYPLLWLAPPLIGLTPFIYLAASLGWLPFAGRHIRQHGRRWLTILLIVGCCLGTGLVGVLMFGTHYPTSCSQDASNSTRWRCYSDYSCASTNLEFHSFLPIGIYQGQVGFCTPYLF